VDILPQKELSMFLLDSMFYEPSPAKPFKYLRNGGAYSVRPERRGNGVYWYMRKHRAGQNVNLYLGPVGSLDSALLNNAVTHIEDHLSSNTQNLQEVVQ
jgi:hypothetical protein